jgi:hypothetical protein
MPNVWLGTTTEDQTRFDQRWPVLRRIPAVVRFISYEPAIGPVRLDRADVQPDWLIAGGESGHGSRAMQAAWVRDVISDCEHQGVAPFFKQWGAISNNPLMAESGMSTKAASAADPHGKGGGLLDGRGPRFDPLCAHQKRNKTNNLRDRLPRSVPPKSRGNVVELGERAKAELGVTWIGSISSRAGVPRDYGVPLDQWKGITPGRP